MIFYFLLHPSVSCKKRHSFETSKYLSPLRDKSAGEFTKDSISPVFLYHVSISGIRKAPENVMWETLSSSKVG